MTIEHRAGSDTFLCIDGEAATRVLYNYVKSWWHQSGSDEDLPEDEDEAIEIYFDDHPQHEGYEIKVHDGIHYMDGGNLLFA